MSQCRSEADPPDVADGNCEQHKPWMLDDFPWKTLAVALASGSPTPMCVRRQRFQTYVFFECVLERGKLTDFCHCNPVWGFRRPSPNDLSVAKPTIAPHTVGRGAKPSIGLADCDKVDKIRESCIVR